MGDPTLVQRHSGGSVWLARSVSTRSGWGLFWLRSESTTPNTASLYYAHVDFAGQTTVPPMKLLDVPRIAFRDRYYLAAWHDDHYGLLICNRATLFYYNLSLDGVLSGARSVGPRLFTSGVYSQESDGDLDSYPGGFLGVIEGECDGHSCSYAFLVDAQGAPTSAVYNLEDYDFTHQFFPRAAYDGSGFAVFTIKDIDLSGGGARTRYLRNGVLSPGTKVVPGKPYLWDEFPDIAWNGSNFAAIWSENSARSDTAPWQMHFASLQRSSTASTLLKDRVLDVWAARPRRPWATQIQPLGPNWVAQYARYQPNGDPLAVFEWLDSQATTMASITPFALSIDALGSGVHPTSGATGILHGDAQSGVIDLTFRILAPPVCAP